MLVKRNGLKYMIPNDHPFAVAIEALAKDYALNKVSSSKGGASAPPERNDVKALWREIGSKHKALLKEIAIRPAGAFQTDLERALDIEWQELRGVHNGLARICERLGVDKPVRTMGYNADNRKYVMDADAAHTVLRLAKRDKV